MTLLAPGDRLLPEGFGVDEFEVRFAGRDVIIDLRGDGKSATLEASEVLSFRFTLEEVYDDYVEGSLNTLLTPHNPGWDLRYRDEDSPYGDFVRTKRFYHLNIPDVGILECWAEAIGRR